ncbi:hypothetical protein BCR42DRAFT_31667 [Absidia repens]|uniref:Uncharacterized protein n=1 Tax=Absidia repens TaxID=90262 RepID=A0A1X2IGE1_9FUNG|nr:hypothetical protein BCR42DRAFT_31667 [Absidia repens]
MENAPTSIPPHLSITRWEAVNTSYFPHDYQKILTLRKLERQQMSALLTQHFCNLPSHLQQYLLSTKHRKTLTSNEEKIKSAEEIALETERRLKVNAIPFTSPRTIVLSTYTLVFFFYGGMIQERGKAEEERRRTTKTGRRETKTRRRTIRRKAETGRRETKARRRTIRRKAETGRRQEKKRTVSITSHIIVYKKCRRKRDNSCRE